MDKNKKEIEIDKTKEIEKQNEMKDYEVEYNLEQKKIVKDYKKFTTISVISMIVFLLFWELITAGLAIFPSYALPSPLMTLKVFFFKFGNAAPDGGTLLEHIWSSLFVVLIGFGGGLILGNIMGILMAWYKPFRMWFKPIFDFLRPIPPVGWVPIFITLIGIGSMSKIMVIFVSAIIPCIINSYSGILQTNEIHINVAKTFGASKREILFKVAIPSALPMIFTGMKVSLQVSWMTLVAAELVASTKGVGYMLQVARTIGRSDIIVMVMFVIAGVGALLTAILIAIEKLLVKR